MSDVTKIFSGRSLRCLTLKGELKIIRRPFALAASANCIKNVAPFFPENLKAVNEPKPMYNGGAPAERNRRSPSDGSHPAVSHGNEPNTCTLSLQSEHLGM